MKKWWMLGLALMVVSVPGLCAAEISFDLQYTTGGFGIGRESFDNPSDVAEDRDENVYVADTGNNRIQVLDRRGKFVREWGGRGLSAGSFDKPAAITVDPSTGYVFVVDSMNHRIQKFDSKGRHLQTIGKFGSGGGDFNNPMDIAIDRKGNIFVADTGNNRIQKFDSSGKFVAEWGKFARQGRGSELKNPVSLAYSSEGFGCVYVLNSPECRVQKFEVDGNLSGSWLMHKKGEGAVCRPSRIRIERRRYTVYIADTENDQVLLFSKDGEPLGELKGAKVPFKKPGGLFVNDVFGEDLVVADTGNHQILKFRRVR